MASYSAPRTTGQIFNAADYNYQDENVSYNDAMTLNSNQIITAEKTFLAQTNMADVVASGTFLLQDVQTRGNTIIGDEGTDILTINCNNSTCQNLDIEGTLTSALTTQIQAEVTDLSTNVVKLTGDQTITGTKTFTDIIIGGDATLGDARSDTLVVESNSTFLNNVVIGDDVSTDTLAANCHTYLNKSVYVRCPISETNDIRLYWAAVLL